MKNDEWMKMVSKFFLPSLLYFCITPFILFIILFLHFFIDITIFLVKLYRVQANEQLALSRLMHIVRCGSAIFPHQALDRRPAQGTLMGCAGLIEKKIVSFEHAPLIYLE
jgi:hypothetical protein